MRRPLTITMRTRILPLVIALAACGDKDDGTTWYPEWGAAATMPTYQLQGLEASESGDVFLLAGGRVQRWHGESAAWDPLYQLPGMTEAYLGADDAGAALAAGQGAAREIAGQRFAAGGAWTGG